MAGVLVWAADKGDRVAVTASGMAEMDDFPLPHDFVGESRPAGEYIGYTYLHLPKFPKNTDAIPASFAARMAFSNF